MKKNLLRTLFVSAVMMGGFSCVHASDSSLEGMFDNLSLGRTVTVSKATFQGYLSTYPELNAALLSGVDVSAVLSICDEIRITSNFSADTMTFDVYSRGNFLAQHVLQDETREDLEGYRNMARQYLSPPVVPEIETRVTPTPVQVVVPARILSPVEQQIADLRALPMTRNIRLQIAKLEQTL